MHRSRVARHAGRRVVKFYELIARATTVDGIVRVTRAWGRAGGGKLTLLELDVPIEAAPHLLAAVEARRTRRGYLIVYERRSGDTLAREIRWTAPSKGRARVARRQLGFAFR